MNANGGGIFATSGAILNLYGGTISDNTCTGSGGGIRVASYDRDRLLDTKTMQLDSIEKIYVDISEIDLNTTGATKITAFLWDSNISPLCATSSQLK